MPKLDFMIPAQFVRQLPGVLDILGAGVDTIHAPVVPTSHPLGLAIRITFDSTDTPGQAHRLRLEFTGEDGNLLTIRATLKAPPKIESVPLHWKTGLGIAIPLTLPIPKYGDYSLTLVIDDERVHDLDLRAIPTPPQGQA
ncbi:DUF6941 family protein [Thermoactinospora rubra]|uniref:DUF6941 family protein n=1 Tax=Thermoactinospora rubra TaxID=1088767 RepID=UPI000A118AF3|nr:hypothetical protein [Thermoactinospora rubra]